MTVVLYLALLAEEVVAQLPHLNLFVCKVLMLNLNQAHFSVAIQIVFKGFINDEGEVIVDLYREAILHPHVAKYGEEDDEQFFFQIHLPLTIHHVHINRDIVLNDCLATTDSFSPVNLIESRMNVFQNESEIVLILIIETLKGNQNIQKGIIDGLARQIIRRNISLPF